MSKSAESARSKFSSVLVGVDFSESSGLAFDRACDVAAHNEASMLIVHVLPAAPMAIHGVQPVLAEPDLSGRIRELAEQKLIELEDEKMQEYNTLLRSQLFSYSWEWFPSMRRCGGDLHSIACGVTST